MFKTIEEYILNIGNDLRECSLENVDISKVDLRNILLPEDKNLFQKIKNKSLFKTMLPERDYSKYNFNDVILTGTTFTSKSIIPIDNDFFQLINKKDLLPNIHLNERDLLANRTFYPSVPSSWVGKKGNFLTRLFGFAL